MTSRALGLTLLLLCGAASASGAVPRANRYTVSIPEGAQRAHVEAPAHHRDDDPDRVPGGAEERQRRPDRAP